VPTKQATVIVERVGWTRGMTVFTDRLRELRPAYLPADPASRTTYEASALGGSMSIYSAARGTVAGAPTWVTAEAGDATALPLGDDRAGDSGGGSSRESQLSRRVLDQVRVGEHLVMMGTLRPSRVVRGEGHCLCAGTPAPEGRNYRCVIPPRTGSDAGWCLDGSHE
jgi:hypothetical protein